MCLADGITYGIVKDENKNSMTFVADVNGNKTPNRGSKDLCRYTISNAGTLSKNCEIMESWSPAATPVCDIDHLEFCTTKEDCASIGGDWAMNPGIIIRMKFPFVQNGAAPMAVVVSNKFLT